MVAGLNWEDSVPGPDGVLPLKLDAFRVPDLIIAADVVRPPLAPLLRVPSLTAAAGLSYTHTAGLRPVHHRAPRRDARPFPVRPPTTTTAWRALDDADPARGHHRLDGPQPDDIRRVRRRGLYVLLPSPSRPALVSLYAPSLTGPRPPLPLAAARGLHADELSQATAERTFWGADEGGAGDLEVRILKFTMR